MLCNKSYKSNVVKESLKNAIFSYIHSIISYGIIFGGNTPNNIKISRMQKINK